MKVIHLTDSTIKGYHIFKLTPFPTIQMLVEKEEGNSYDNLVQEDVSYKPDYWMWDCRDTMREEAVRKYWRKF